MKTARILLVLVSFMNFGLLLAACQEQVVTSLDSVRGSNSKLSSELNRLVQADSQGEGVLFAQQQNIYLIDGKVRVIVEVMPDKMENVTNAIIEVGTIETSYQNLVQAVVPISNLPQLSQGPGIKLIRLPLQAFPDTGGSNIK